VRFSQYVIFNFATRSRRKSKIWAHGVLPRNCHSATNQTKGWYERVVISDTSMVFRSDKIAAWSKRWSCDQSKALGKPWKINPNVKPIGDQHWSSFWFSNKQHYLSAHVRISTNMNIPQVCQSLTFVVNATVEQQRTLASCYKDAKGDTLHGSTLQLAPVGSSQWNPARIILGDRALYQTGLGSTGGPSYEEHPL